MSIKFYPETHQYFDKLNQEYISVNKLIEECLGAFDVDGVIDKIINMPWSVYYKKTKKEVLTLWGNITKTGTEAHTAIEEYIRHDILPDNSDLKSIVKKFSKFEFNGELTSEVMAWDEINLIAGTMDIVEQTSDCLRIWDIKTSRKIGDEKHHKYSIQLGFYKHLLGLRTRMPVEVGGILWIKDYFNNRGSSQIYKIDVDSCDNEVRDMINTRKIKLWKQGWKQKQKENENAYKMDRK